MKTRADHTQSWIVEAFHRLVLHRRYEAINVADVVARAGVGRSTFYEHFGGKAELLRHAVAPVLAPLAAAVTDDGECSSVEAMLDHVEFNRAATLSMLAGPGGVEVERTLAELIDHRLPPGANNALPRALLARQVAHAQLGVLRAWLEPSARPCPASTLAASLVRTTRALARAGVGDS